MTQDEAIKILTTGQNVFLTGEPGSGKTHTVNQYVTWLREHGIEPAITASTGIAATHIGGYTIHSWSGIGISTQLTASDIVRIAQNRNVASRIQDTHVLIIDEVSMLSAATITMVDAVCRKIRGDTRAFGGMQVVLVGDFFQLPPIIRREQSEQAEFASVGEAAAVFAYDAPVWKELELTVCYLSEQHRQEDAEFLELLTAIRRANFSDRHRELLAGRYQSSSEETTRLYSHNADVDTMNTGQLNKLAGETHRFEMEAQGAAKLTEAIMRGCLSPEILVLKEGARVMFTKNDSATRKFMNGTLGIVTGFAKETGYPIVKLRSGRTVEAEPMEWSLQDEGRVLARVTQVPLRLAWAITVHKSQGMSLDAAHIDLSRAFEYGQGYVALSRIRTLKGLSLAGINQRATEVHPEILEKDRSFRVESEIAEKSFSKLSATELQQKEKEFIIACGGNLVASKVVPKKKKVKASTQEMTKELLLANLSLEQIAEERGLALTTVIGHLEELVEEKKINPIKELAYMIQGQETTIGKIHSAFSEMGTRPLKPVFEYFDERISYETLRLARLLYEEKETLKR